MQENIRQFSTLVGAILFDDLTGDLRRCVAASMAGAGDSTRHVADMPGNAEGEIAGKLD